MAIYKTIKGEKVQLNARQIKSSILKNTGWSEQEYNKNRYILKNKLRTYEAFQRAAGYEVQEQSPVEILYYQTRQQKKQGSNYKMSAQLAEIYKQTSYGSKAAIQHALSSTKARKRQVAAYNTETYNSFKQFIKASPHAKRLWEGIENPVKRRKALVALADELNYIQKKDREYIKNQAIPFGDVAGSETELNWFPMEDWLDQPNTTKN